MEEPFTKVPDVFPKILMLRRSVMEANEGEHWTNELKSEQTFSRQNAMADQGAG